MGSNSRPSTTDTRSCCGGSSAGAVFRQRKAYPVYDETYGERLAVIESFLRGLTNLQMVGRNGLHKYNNQDHSMMTGFLAVENLYGARHDIWQYNSDQAYQEETSAPQDTQ
jgi:hypothetical protein